MDKKILIVSASVGSGHARAGIALEKTVRILYPEYYVKHVDFLNFLNASAKKIIVDMYNSTILRFPELWKLYYNASNMKHVSGALKRAVSFISAAKGLKVDKFIKFTRELKPDIIISTHFLPPIALQNVKSRAVKGTVITDYTAHRLWVVCQSDYYFASTEEMKSFLEKENVDSNKIIISGIPVDPVFFEYKPKDELKKKYRLPKDEPILLVLSGGHGLADMASIIKDIFGIKRKMIIIAVAGKNEEMKKKLIKLETPPNVKLNVMGWTDQIDELMRISDIIITKPGGLTTTECLVLGKPIITVSPIPGQEDANVEFIEKNNFGKIADSEESLISAVDFYLKNKIKFPRFQKRPAAEIILETLVAASNKKAD